MAWNDDADETLLIMDADGTVRMAWHDYRVRGEPADPPEQPFEAERGVAKRSEMPTGWENMLRARGLAKADVPNVRRRGPPENGPDMTDFGGN